MHGSGLEVSIFRSRKATQASYDKIKRRAQKEGGRRKKALELFTQMHEGGSADAAKAEEQFKQLFASDRDAKKFYDQLMQGEVDREGLK